LKIVLDSIKLPSNETHAIIPHENNKNNENNGNFNRNSNKNIEGIKITKDDFFEQ